MTDLQAIDYSLIVWKYKKDTGCTTFILSEWLQKKHPEILKLKAFCGLCEKYINCKGCLLYKKWNMKCTDYNSFYCKWCNAKTKRTRIKYATLIYNDLLNIKKELKINLKKS